MVLPSTYFGDRHTRANRRFVIMCEGKDDAYFIDKLCTEIGADPEKVGVVCSGGETNISKEVRLLMKSSTFVDGTTERVIIIRDSDSDGQKNLEKLSLELQPKGWPALANGEMIDCEIGSFQRKIGYFSIPSIDQKGALEDLVLYSVAEDNRYKRAGKVLDDQIEETGDLDKYSKRKIHIYLSLYPTQWRGAGMATKAGVFDIRHPCFNDLREFLTTATSEG